MSDWRFKGLMKSNMSNISSCWHCHHRVHHDGFGRLPFEFASSWFPSCEPSPFSFDCCCCCCASFEGHFELKYWCCFACYWHCLRLDHLHHLLRRHRHFRHPLHLHPFRRLHLHHLRPPRRRRHPHHRHHHFHDRLPLDEWRPRLSPTQPWRLVDPQPWSSPGLQVQEDERTWRKWLAHVCEVQWIRPCWHCPIANGATPWHSRRHSHNVPQRNLACHGLPWAAEVPQFAPIPVRI
mmetsp:Transcript_118981/g.344134  ORF Transcript_118981/g.344134 Transcript_118981/m.344134 type:complete len:236 (-) Transcript_118981:341-1048(-)